MKDPVAPEEQKPPSPQTNGSASVPEKKYFRLSLPVLTGIAVAFLPLFLALALILPLPIKKDTAVIVQRGTNVQTIADSIRESGIPVNDYIFRFAARFLAGDSLKAGEYRLSPGQNLIDVVSMMHDGQSVVRLFTVAEGLTSSEIAALLANDPVLNGDVKKVPEEGTLLPETYRYSYGDSRADIIDRMQKSLHETLNDLWEKREPGLPLATPHEALVLASIVEKETGKKAEERARVAGVFINRLRKGMPLQSDPTVIYALTEGKKPLGRNLARTDLTAASPYNTYLHAGLPPKPICNPGHAALEAALHPEKNDFLYFVADGTGGHAFSKDLSEHNKNVNRWQNLSKK